MSPSEASRAANVTQEGMAIHGLVGPRLSLAWLKGDDA